MDLAPRSLLAERGIGLDLVAPKSIAALFRGDRWFGRVFDDSSPIVASDYDFAIVDSLSLAALAGKRKAAPTLPWVTVLGDYVAYDFQRGGLAARRLAALLQMPLEPGAERWHARQKLQIGVDDAAPCEDPPRVALALGGVRTERTYRHWPEVARALYGAGHTRFALVGSDNGVAVAAAVKAAIGGADVLDLVATTDLHGSQQAMARCALVVCADGGLLHLACTTSRPILALFDSSIDPAWRLPMDAAVTALRADVRDVSAVAPATVAAAAMAMLGRPHAGGGSSHQDDVVLLR